MGNIEIPDCPPGGTMWGRKELFNAFQQTKLATYEQKAKEFLKENADKRWVVYRDDFSLPLESGPASTCLPEGDDCYAEAKEWFGGLEERHGRNENTQIFVYFRRATSIEAVAHARRFIMYSDELKIVQGLKEKGLA